MTSENSDFVFILLILYISDQCVLVDILCFTVDDSLMVSLFSTTLDSQLTVQETHSSRISKSFMNLLIQPRKLYQREIIALIRISNFDKSF